MPDLIEYGIPIDFNRSQPLVPTEATHASRHEYGSDIEKYLTEEVAFNAMYGPFQEKPINMHIFSYDRYLDSYYYLSYPSIDIVDRLKQLGPGALLYKVDISRAFCHIRMEARDLDLLGLKHNSYYLDGSLAFGFRHGSFSFRNVQMPLGI